MLLKLPKDLRENMPSFYIVDVKHGNSSVLIDINGIIIIDAGLRSELLEFLESKGINKIDVLLFSHSHADHIGGAMALLSPSSKISIDAVYINTDSENNSELYDDLIYTLYEKDKMGLINFEESITPELTGQLNQGDVHIEILAPNECLLSKSKLKPNSMSVVLRFIYNEEAIILLTGDMDTIGLKNLLNDKPVMQAKLLVFPHHGGNAGGNMRQYTQLLCSQVQAEHIVFSIGDNTDKFPLKAVIEAIS